MKAFSLVICLCLSLTAFASSKFTASGRAKAFKGPEGEVITIVPLNENTKLLVFAHNTYGPATDRALIYDFDDSTANPNAGIPRPDLAKDSERIPRMLVINKVDEQWIYSDAINAERIKRIKLTYSEELSKNIKVNDLLKTATVASAQ